MGRERKDHQTLVGTIATEVLAYTAGNDIKLDACLLEADCIGTAAHVTMLARLPGQAKVFKAHERNKIVAELVRIMRQFQREKMLIRPDDQDVHMAVERILTKKLGDLGRKIHVGRSRNDQAAVDLRLYSKECLLATISAALTLAMALLRFAKAHVRTPMVGRTHMQPAMPSSVGLWASAYAESLLEDVQLLKSAYQLNDQCPLGSAAGYGVPLPIDRQSVSDLLGFRSPLHNVFHAGNTRGKMEAIILSALSQAMLSLSRLAQDMLLFTMPEFNYFLLPSNMGTGSSIMPQKNNPDVLELVRARSAKVISYACATMHLVSGLPGGYNRDLQEAKEPLMSGLQLTSSSLQIMRSLIACTKVNQPALAAGFSPAVFAADVAMDKVNQGMAFRDAYLYVKGHLQELERVDPLQAIMRKKHLGAPAGLDFKMLIERIQAAQRLERQEARRYYRIISQLLGVNYPLGC